MADGQTPAAVAQPDDWQDTTPQVNDWQDTTPSQAATVGDKKPMGLTPPTWSDVVTGFPGFVKQVGQAAGNDISNAWQGIKSGVSSAASSLKQDPSRIVPMWFGGMMDVAGSGAKAVATPVSALWHGDISDAISTAAGGDPKAARDYHNQGNMGGEFWEMAGKPIAMLATGKALGMIGSAIPEGADIARLRVVRGLMRDTSTTAGVDLSQAQLAQQALQDAAREAYGTGAAGESAMGKALPSRDRGLLDILKGGPLTTSKVEAGNAELMRLSKRAVEIAGTPADRVNGIFGYMDGRASANNIKNSLLTQADEAAKNGLTSYANALKQRAASMDGKQTLGEIYDVKKAANKLSGVVKNTQESIDLMDSWSALAGAIRNEVYPIYERQVQSTMGGGASFSVAQAGRKEGASIALRNGLEKRLAMAQGASDELQIPGHVTTMASHGAPEHRLGMASIVRKAQETGVIPTEQGSFNTAGRKAIGPLSPDTVPENLTIKSPAKFGPAPPPTRNLLPGSTMKFEIPGNLPDIGTEGQIAHPAAQVPHHSFEPPPMYTTSSAAREATPTVYAPKNPSTGVQRVVREGKTVNEGQMGADIRTQGLPEAQTDVAKGPGTIITTDPKMAQESLAKMKMLQDHNVARGVSNPELNQAIMKLENQLKEYQKGIGPAVISHTPPVLTSTPRVSGTIPVRHLVRASAPAALADIEREHRKSR